MYLHKLLKLGLHADSDFRARATVGVALAALCLLLPIALLNLFNGTIVTGIGSLGIVILLSINVVLVRHGRSHQSLTLFGLVPAGMIFMITVFQYDGIIGSLWCYPSILACYCMLSERRAWAANLIILVICLSMVAITLPLKYSLRITATLIALSIFSAILVRVIDKLNQKLQHQLVRDPMTGLLNRLTLKCRLEQAVAEHKNTSTSASILAIDVDHFKSINDRYGHDVGDKTLVKLTHLMSSCLRHNDCAFRTGGEEFLVLLNGAGEREAYLVAEQLRRKIEVADIIARESVTASIGVAEYSPDENWTGWVKRADEYLYHAKQLGRNRVTLAGEPKKRSITTAASAGHDSPLRNLND